MCVSSVNLGTRVCVGRFEAHCWVCVCVCLCVCVFVCVCITSYVRMCASHRMCVCVLCTLENQTGYVHLMYVHLTYVYT